MALNQERGDMITHSPSNSNDEVTDYLSMSGINPNPMVLLICIEKIDGEPLTESLLTPRHINTFCF